MLFLQGVVPFVPIEIRKEIRKIKNNSFLVFLFISNYWYNILKYLRTLRRQTFRISLYNNTVNAKIYELPEHSWICIRCQLDCDSLLEFQCNYATKTWILGTFKDDICYYLAVWYSISVNTGLMPIKVHSNSRRTALHHWSSQKPDEENSTVFLRCIYIMNSVLNFKLFSKAIFCVRQWVWLVWRDSLCGQKIKYNFCTPIGTKLSSLEVLKTVSLV